MKPIPENGSCSFAWPPYDKPGAQWYTMTWKDDQKIKSILGPERTHAQTLEWLDRVAPHEKQQFGNFIHIRLLEY